MSPRARHAKSKARLAAYETAARRGAEREARPRSRSTSRPGPRLGDVVVEAEHVSKGFGDRLLIEDLSFSLPPGGIVGVIGPNGAGKTTLFRMIDGRGAARRGHALRVGDTVRARLRRPVARRARPAEHGLEGDLRAATTRSTLGQARGQLAASTSSWFNFKGADQQKRVGDLSGGERNRVHLAKLLRVGRQRAAPRRADERPRRRHAARARGGAARLRRLRGRDLATTAGSSTAIATHILAFEGDSQAVWFEGNYEEYEEHRHAPARRRGRPAAPDQVQAARSHS